MEAMACSLRPKECGLMNLINVIYSGNLDLSELLALHLAAILSPRGRMIDQALPMKKMNSTMKAPETDALVGLNYPSTSIRCKRSRTHVVDLVHGSLETRERSTQYSTSKRENWILIIS
jgi:hypothetical protein